MQAWLRGVGTMVAAALVVVGCGGGDEFVAPSESPSAICDKIADQCDTLTGPSGGPIGRSECLNLFEALVIPAGCTSAVRGSTCEELVLASGPLATCFPPCDGQEFTCTEHGVERCSEGRTYVTDCAAVCEDLNRTWNGSCDPEVTGGEPRCWCQ